VNVAKYQKGVYYLGVKVFNALPSDIQKFLCEKSFYSLDEYFDLHIYTSTNLYYNLFVYYLKKVLFIICNALNLCSVTILNLS
jgi:hypothetical protein